MTALLLSLTLAAAHPTMQVYFQSNLASVDYQKGVFQKVSKLWSPPGAKPPVGKKTVVQAIIARDGSILTSAVLLESGSRQWDAAALSAVKRAGPFKPLPKDFGAASVEVHFHLAWEG